jgi:hypothetical protein
MISFGGDMSDNNSHICSETGRTFATAEAARASERRFRDVQAACDVCELPELRAGDVIYVDTSIYLSHGRDDFRGGLAEVAAYTTDLIPGKAAPFVRVAQDPSTWHSWLRLAAKQKELRARFGKYWSHPDPDLRPEFNEW